MKSISFDQIKTMLKSMSYPIFTRLGIVEKDIDGIKAMIPAAEKEIIFTKGEDGKYSCNIPHAELWKMDADAIGRNSRIIDGNKVYGVRSASKKTESLYGNVIQVYADLNVGSYDIPANFHRTLILTYCVPGSLGTEVIFAEEVSSLNNSKPDLSSPSIPVLDTNGQWRNASAYFMEMNEGYTGYTLKTMSPTVKGGAKVGEGLEIVGDALRVKPEGEYELIETITLNAATTSIVRSEYPNGEKYNLKEAVVTIISQGSGDTSVAKFGPYIKAYVNDTENLRVYLASLFTVYKAMASCYFYTRGGYLYCDGFLPSTAYDNVGAAFASNIATINKIKYSPIKKLELTVVLPNSLPTGTVVEIWGVRA